jgi:two-component system cell cycle sensor histidine kinase/response regulator CckA
MEANGCHETILVADDEPQVLELIAELLSQKGYTVLLAADGEEALRVAEAHPGRVDLLLTDVVMPGMSGTELARYLRLSRPGLRVTYMSGYIRTRSDLGRLLESGAAFLPKPFPPGQLLSTVRAVLDAPAGQGF